MKKDLTELVFILDRSGSMQGLERDTIGGFNGMIEKQKKAEGTALVSTILFDDASKVIHNRLPIADVPQMTEEDYYVGGCTALLDTIGEAVHHIEYVHSHTQEEYLPEKTVFVITTDGQENASTRHTFKEVREMIEYEENAHHWQFLFLGANIDAIGTAASFGIKADHAVNYTSDEQGTALNYETICETITQYRSSRVRPSEGIPAEWKKKIEDREQKKH
ncbi:MAG: VWA domain-containing protein [Lachnospiraceae bacterium]|nr:VWA domain-containing protein [Lachnospiraceae bacterium]